MTFTGLYNTHPHYMQTTLMKFFKFQIEEDVMRQLVEQVFSTLKDLKSRRMGSQGILRYTRYLDQH